MQWWSYGSQRKESCPCMWKATLGPGNPGEWKDEFVGDTNVVSRRIG